MITEPSKIQLTNRLALFIASMNSCEGKRIEPDIYLRSDDKVKDLCKAELLNVVYGKERFSP